jgi:hypothetical protein
VTSRVTGRLNPPYDLTVIVYVVEPPEKTIREVGLASIGKSVAKAGCVSTRIVKTIVEVRSLGLKERQTTFLAAKA